MSCTEEKYIEFWGKKSGTSLESICYEVNNGSSEFGGGTYVCKELAYSYAMWVSCEFHHAVITTFDRVISAESTADLIAAKEWAMNELVQMESREPNDKQSLACHWALLLHELTLTLNI